MAKKVDLNKHIWEGWTVKDFINDLEMFVNGRKFKNREELKAFCMDNQPYYKKYIPDVVNHFENQIKYTDND